MATKRPAARHDGITTASVGDDIVLYDAEHGHYHALDACAAAVWMLADGTRSAALIARESGLNADAVALALDQLAELDLLASAPSPVTTLDRRKLVVRLAAAGIAAPVIGSITAAHASASLSGCLPPGMPGCFRDVDCCPPTDALCSVSVCFNGSCIPVARSCDDGNACTIDSCDSSFGCTHTPIDCTGSDPCFVGTCNPVLGCVMTPVTCPSPRECHVSNGCNPGVGCVESLAPDTTPCVGGQCFSGTCVPS